MTPKTIIIVNVTESEYKSYIHSCDFSLFCCPTCEGPVKYHARYLKSLYDKVITILRVYCINKDCRKTHALIPSFSVPCLSIGTRELNKFITARKNRKTVCEAGQCFIDAGMSPDYTEFIHRRLNKVIQKIRTIFTPLVSGGISYDDLIFQIAGSEKVNPVSELNELCYDYGFNPILFSRSNILLLKRNNSSVSFSHEPPSRPPPASVMVPYK